MLTLAIDTSSAVTAVAVHADAGVLAERSHVEPNRHGEVLAPAIAEVLAEAGVTARDLARVAVGVGPGPFTGLRIGLMTARSIGHARGIPVVGVVSLDSLAAQVRGRAVAVVTDARRREVYAATYDGSEVRVTGPEVARPDVVAAALSDSGFDGVVVGPGAELYAGTFSGWEVQPGVTASAGQVALLAAAGRTAESTAPLYLRRPDATPPAARKPALA